MKRLALPLITATLPGLAAAQGAQVAVMAPPLPPNQIVQQTWPAGERVDIPLQIGGDGSGRLVFSTLRTGTALQAVTLFDPQGREIWRRSAGALNTIPQAQAAQPQWGDAIPLPEQPRPMPGRWLLRLERAPGATQAQLMFGWQLLPRFSLGLWRPGDRPAVNQPVLLLLRPTEGGQPVTQGADLQLRIQPSGAAALALTPRQDLEGPIGGPISREPGAYLVQWRPTVPGVHEVQARWLPPGASAPLVATFRADVSPALAQVQFKGLTAEGPPECLQGLRLRFEVILSEAPAAGTELVLAARLKGARELRQFSVALPMPGRQVMPEVRLSAADLRQLGWPLQQLTSSQVTRFAPELKVLATGEAVDLQPLLPRGAAPCP